MPGNYTAHSPRSRFRRHSLKPSHINGPIFLRTQPQVSKPSPVTANDGSTTCPITNSVTRCFESFRSNNFRPSTLQQKWKNTTTHSARAYRYAQRCQSPANAVPTV